jgi:hypothetical protein
MIDPDEKLVNAIITAATMTCGRTFGHSDVLNEMNVPLDRRDKVVSMRIGAKLHEMGAIREFIDVDGSGRRVWRWHFE